MATHACVLAKKVVVNAWTNTPKIKGSNVPVMKVKSRISMPTNCAKEARRSTVDMLKCVKAQIDMNVPGSVKSEIEMEHRLTIVIELSL